MGGGCRPLPCAIRGVRDPIADCPAVVHKPAALHWAPRPRILGRPRHRLGGTLDPTDPRVSKRAGGRYSAPSVSGVGGTFAKKNGAGAGESPDDEEADGARRSSSRYHREPPERGKQNYHGSGTDRNDPDEVRGQLDNTRGDSSAK